MQAVLECLFKQNIAPEQPYTAGLGIVAQAQTVSPELGFQALKQVHP